MKFWSLEICLVCRYWRRKPLLTTYQDQESYIENGYKEEELGFCFVDKRTSMMPMDETCGRWSQIKKPRITPKWLRILYDKE